MTRKVAFLSCVLSALISAHLGCKKADQTEPAAPPSEAPKAEPAPAPPAEPAAADPASAPAAAADPRCADPAALRAEALEKGKKIFAGVKLEKSTPIPDILAKMAENEGKPFQIEGKVVDRCPGAGCWALLEDAAGKQLRLKVNDGDIDFRTETPVGAYMVGDGIFHEKGHHGPEIYIKDHGAVVGTVVCN